MPKVLFIDFETRSSQDLGDVGAHRYCSDNSTELLMLSYAFDTDPVQVCESVPDTVWDAIENPKILKIAHNAEFDMCVCKYVLGIEVNFTDWHDTAYQASYYGFPRALGHIATMLQTTNKASSKDMLLFSTPVKVAKKVKEQADYVPSFVDRSSHPEEWANFIEYTRIDTEVLRECYEKMTGIPKIETFVMQETFIMNFNGVPVDVPLALKIFERSQDYTKDAGDIALEKYGIKNLRSTIQVRTALFDAGIVIKSLNVKERDGIDHEILDLRDQATGSAFSKIPKLCARICSDRKLHGEFVGHGAHTGRWSSRGVQLQNWARIFSKVDESLAYVKDYSHLRQHMRLCLGYERGRGFTFADLSQIEARIVAWLANSEWRMNAFANGEDIYARSAERLFKIPYAAKDSQERFTGKTYELALGFGGGKAAVQRMAPEFYKKRGEGTVMDDVVKWRANNPEIVVLWKKLENAFMAAVKEGSCRIMCGQAKLTFQFDGKTARIVLPSGRALYYRGTSVYGGPYGYEIRYLDYTLGGEHAKHVKMWGGSFLENVTQAIARDVIVDIMVRVKHLYPNLCLIGTVHDEIWYSHETSYGNTALSALLEEMAKAIPWAKGLVTSGEGFTSDRYRK